MPLKIYCPSCSEPNEYTLNKPIFCSFCAAKFEGSISIASQKPKIVKSLIKRQRIEEDDEDFDALNDDESLPDISALELDVPIDKQKDKGISLGEVIKQQKTGLEREKSKKINKKKEFAAFLEQAKNTRKPIEVEESGAQ